MRERIDESNSSQTQQLLSWISVSNDELVWGVDTSGTVYEYVAASQEWQRVDTSSPFAQVAVGSSNNIWGLDASGKVYRYSGSGKWQDMGVSASFISAASDGSFWIINNDIYIYTTDGFLQVQNQGSMVTISAVSSNNFWGLDAQGKILQYDSGNWTIVPGPNMREISATSTGEVWAIDYNNQIYLYIDTNKWYETAGQLKQISAGNSTSVWGIDLDGYALNLIPPSAIRENSSGEKVFVPHNIPRWDAEDPFDQTRSTHLWIVNRAAELASNYGSVGNQIYNLIKPNRPHIGDAFHDNLCQGIYDADFKSPYNNPEYGQPTYKSHFFDPDTGKNYEGDSTPTALTNGRVYFSGAKAAWLAGDRVQAGYQLGLALHYLTDLTQPMHAANFTYMSSWHWGYHTAFESFVMRIQNPSLMPNSYQPSRLGSDPQGYLLAAAKQSKSYNREICKDKWAQKYGLQPHSVWQNGVRPIVNQILPEAITITSQFLVAWMSSV